jgi:hypothetical protein
LAFGCRPCLRNLKVNLSLVAVGCGRAASGFLNFDQGRACFALRRRRGSRSSHCHPGRTDGSSVGLRAVLFGLCCSCSLGFEWVGMRPEMGSLVTSSCLKACLKVGDAHCSKLMNCGIDSVFCFRIAAEQSA